MTDFRPAALESLAKGEVRSAPTVDADAFAPVAGGLYAELDALVAVESGSYAQLSTGGSPRG